MLTNGLTKKVQSPVAESSGPDGRG